ncbi:WD40 repeat-like protein [Coprinopsis marcescibilis]|uniref:WD40 repeat-like protein n=1 Tax=Coprinopsis marcescibilis TaxID=230819 RepID=A0A5C3LAE5_COPMA|nr:WD40 repeat-like protein [Coprinopsis marcescibilis]
MSKRSHSPPPSYGAGALIKKAKGTSPTPSNQIVISSSGDDRSKGLIRSVPRTSNLEAPIVSLAGAHSGEILSCRFDPSGQNIAACSGDRSVSLWRTYAPNTNYGLLSSHHKAPILDLQWSLRSPILYTVSADHTLTFTDLTTGQKLKRIRAHREIINTLDRTMASGSGTELLATGSDDGTVKVWAGGSDDPSSSDKQPIATLDIGCPVTAVAWSQDGANLYIGAIDNEIHVYDLRKQQEVYSLGGHTDTPTSLALSPDGCFLLSPSLSSQTIVHDVRPFSPSATRIHRTLLGAPAGFENTLLRGAWSKEDGGRRVAVGGADRAVCIWDVESSRILYKLPGHKGTVTAVDFHPKEPIILTGSKDGTMLLGEIEPSIHV